MTSAAGPHRDEIEAARAYEDLHVGALFQQWADPILDAAEVGPGDAVLDVACGTGVAARAAVSRVGPGGAVTGLDIGAGMLAVAEEIEPAVRWVHGDAIDLPFEDDEFDATVCPFGLMFFTDRPQAVAEMLRCTKPGGHVALAVWEALDRSPAYPVSVDLLERHAGTAAADALRAPFVLGEPEDVVDLVAAAGAGAVDVDTHFGTARFPSIRTMVEADLRGWLPVMGVELDEATIATILLEAEEALARYRTEDGEMTFLAPAHIVVASAQEPEA